MGFPITLLEFPFSINLLLIKRLTLWLSKLNKLKSFSKFPISLWIFKFSHEYILPKNLGITCVLKSFMNDRSSLHVPIYIFPVSDICLLFLLFRWSQSGAPSAGNSQWSQFRPNAVRFWASGLESGVVTRGGRSQPWHGLARLFRTCLTFRRRFQSPLRKSGFQMQSQNLNIRNYIMSYPIIKKLILIKYKIIRMKTLIHQKIFSRGLKTIYQLF